MKRWTRPSPTHLAVALLLLLLAGCASHGPLAPDGEPVADTRVTACRGYFLLFDDLTARHHARDYQSAMIAGFPYLRVNRFLAAVRPASDDHVEFDAWVARLQSLDHNARRYELANLPVQAQEQLRQRAPQAFADMDVVQECGNVLRTHELATRPQREDLAARAVVPDNYSSFRRALGLYPFSALIVRASIKHWQNDVRRRFAQDDPPPSGHWQRYVPPHGDALSADSIAAMLSSRIDELGIPSPTPNELAALFHTFAPVWEIDTVDDNDRPGQPYWRTATTPDVDIARPAVYTHVSYARFDGETLLQLNYMLWFRARPSSGAFDIAAGLMDGVYWRVTLGRDGRPLIYDSIHPCGCYHLFFPNSTLHPKPMRLLYQEPTLVPRDAPSLPDGARLRLRITAHAHYLAQLYVDAAEDAAASAVAYDLIDYDVLRSLSMADGTPRNLFADRGFVPGTQRAERWLLWPMGIPNPGAMRQWGNHATAFVGRRHFDDPDLFAKYFRSAAAP